jgi:hypothetical protein
MITKSTKITISWGLTPCSLGYIYDCPEKCIASTFKVEQYSSTTKMEELKSPGMQFQVILYIGTNVPGIHTTSIFRVKNILQVKTFLYCRWSQQIQPKG